MASIFDELRKSYGAASAEQKLHILRRELLRPILTVESSAKLLQTTSERIAANLPEEINAEEFKNTVNWLADAARDLQQILNALTEDTSQVPDQYGNG